MRHKDLHKCVVPLEQALKILSEFPSYHDALRQEYEHPNDFGSTNAIIIEAEEIANGVNDYFWERINDSIMELENHRDKCVFSAMIGKPYFD